MTEQSQEQSQEQSLPERAQEAHRVAMLEDAAQRLLLARNRLKARVKGILSIDVEPIRDEVLIDGLRIRAPRFAELAVVQQCQVCAAEFEGGFSSLEGLGAQLANGTKCIPCATTKPPEPTTEQRLLEALREWVRDVVEQ